MESAMENSVVTVIGIYSSQKIEKPRHSWVYVSALAETQCHEGSNYLDPNELREDTPLSKIPSITQVTACPTKVVMTAAAGGGGAAIIRCG
ncbi:hypothetical protein Tco_0882025 [Tanacetum coccineum]